MAPAMAYSLTMPSSRRSFKERMTSENEFTSQILIDLDAFHRKLDSQAEARCRRELGAPETFIEGDIAA